MKVVCVQTNPEFKNPAKSKKRIQAVLDDLNGPVDLIVMPEMALVGYKFISPEDIMPYCEIVCSQTQNITPDMTTLSFAHETSKKFQAWIACGFAERASDGKLYNS